MPPVDDHPVHEKTRIGANHKNGCHNHPPFSPGYWTTTRQYREDGRFDIVEVFIPHTMSTDCKYDQRLVPEFCAGCKHINPKYGREVR